LLRNDVSEGYVDGLVLSLLLGEVLETVIARVLGSRFSAWLLLAIVLKVECTSHVPETGAVTSDVLLTRLFVTLLFRYIGGVRNEACKAKLVYHVPYGKS
jgi:hypothetical protein